MRPNHDLQPIAPHPATRWLSVRLVCVLAPAMLVACIDGVTPTNPSSVAPSSVSASTNAERSTAPATLAWELTARKLVAAHPSTMTPISAARAYALLGVAQYGAAVASDESLGISSEDGDASIGADDGGRAQYESRRGAIGEASRVVLTALFPDAADALKTQLDAEAIGPNGRTHPQFNRGKDIGSAMGAVMNAWAAADGFSAHWNGQPYLAGTPGQWYQKSPTVAPIGFQFPAMRPYLMTSPAQFHPAAPPVFGSAEFLANLKEVRDIAASRTAEQIRIANFWNLPPGTPTALGHWDEEAARYITEYGLGDRSAAHVIALTNVAGLDATIGCWEAKYTYLVLRPFQNPGGVATVFGTPDHPSYPSGHSCLSAAAATVLAFYFPTKATELEAGVEEAGDSRVYAGIHYRSDVNGGRILGRAVGNWSLNYDHTQGLLTAVGR